MSRKMGARRGKVAEILVPYKQWGFTGRQESSNLQTDKNRTFGVLSVCLADKKKVGKGGNLLWPYLACWALCSHYSRIRLQVRSAHHALTPCHFWSKLNKEKIPPPLGKLGLGWKSGNITPHTPLSQWLFLPFICMPLTGLPRKPRATALHLSARSPCKSISCLNQLCFLS